MTPVFETFNLPEQMQPGVSPRMSYFGIAYRMNHIYCGAPRTLDGSFECVRDLAVNEGKHYRLVTENVFEYVGCGTRRASFIIE